MASESQSQTLPTKVWPSKVIPPPPTVFAITQILGFFEDLGYDKTVKTLRKEAVSKGLELDAPEVKALQGPFKKSLGELYADALLQEEDEDESSVEDSSEEEEEESDDDGDSSDDDSSDSDSDSSSESDAEEDTTTTAKPAALKRKRDDSSDSSSSESDSSSDSDDDEAPPTKKNKTVAGAEDTSEDSSDDEASSVSSSEVSSDSESSSESESDSDSSSDEEEVPAAPAAVKKSDAKKSTAKSDAKQSTAKPKVSDDESQASSATLEAEPTKPEDNGGMHPARASRMNPGSSAPVDKSKKKNNVPFSRIPKDTYVDPRFASNAYVSYDYADRAHQDLIVTKGKGFTKEKNKKKRGSYRGGIIDTTPKGIKFDD